MPRAFPFKIGNPCLVEIDTKQKRLTIKPISKNEAAKLGLKKRKRREEHENTHTYSFTVSLFPPKRTEPLLTMELAMSATNPSLGDEI